LPDAVCARGASPNQISQSGNIGGSRFVKMGDDFLKKFADAEINGGTIPPYDGFGAFG
jgi:hypothetical protein